MTARKKAIESIQELPDDCSLDEMADRLEFLAAIQKGLNIVKTVPSLVRLKTTYRNTLSTGGKPRLSEAVLPSRPHSLCLSEFATPPDLLRPRRVKPGEKCGLDQRDRGEGIPHEEIKKQLASWLIE